MSETENNTQSVVGKKIFFINPNLTIFPETFCSDYMAMGFECYFIMKDSLVSLEEKIDILVKKVKDIVLFFNIDAPDPKPGVTWLQFIKILNNRYETRPLIGIMYAKRPSQNDVEQTNFLYENEARATCGAHMLEFNKRKNFEIILQALANIGAIGRRKNVRVICSANCKIRFNYNHNDYFISLTDMSMSHFTGTFESGTFTADVNERIRDIEFNIKGLRFGHNATILLKRPVAPGKDLFVFAFTNKKDLPGLDETIKNDLLEKLYDIQNENFRKQFDQYYEETQASENSEKK